jgi:enoyl-CoA hydratase
MGAEAHLLVERLGHVVRLTLNRPEARNAFSLEMLARLADAWDAIDEDPEVRVAILTGAGGTFSSGADLKMMHGDQSANPWHARFREDPDLHWKGFLRHRRLRKPLVAAVEGYAYGGGAEILWATDIRVAGESARIGVTEARWGLFPLGGSTARLPRQIPYTKAMEMLLMAEPVSAQEALAMGMVGRVVPDDQVQAEALRCAEKIAANGPLAVQAIKRSVVEGLVRPLDEALAHELEVGSPVFKTQDAREGPRAFAEKRPAKFTAQ